MKINRYATTNRLKSSSLALAIAIVSALIGLSPSFADDAASFTTSAATAVDELPRSSPTVSAPVATPAILSQTQSTAGAVEMIDRVIASLAHGPAFDAKVRQRVWTSDREMVGVGTYKQAGGGSGQFNLQLTMHDGDGKHTLQQISDGRLAWTRSEIANNVTLKRVDVGRIGEWVSQRDSLGGVSPRLRIGAWTEMLDTISRDYILRLAAGTLEAQTVWILSGTLRPEAREEVLKMSGRTDWPPLYPTHVKIAIARGPLGDSGFGEGLPIRIEFWPSDTKAVPETSETSGLRVAPRMITLIELYSIRPIDPPSVVRFRFENQDAAVNFINETDRYLQRYGIQLTDSERKRMRR